MWLRLALNSLPSLLHFWVLELEGCAPTTSLIWILSNAMQTFIWKNSVGTWAQGQSYDSSDQQRSWRRPWSISVRSSGVSVRSKDSMRHLSQDKVNKGWGERGIGTVLCFCKCRPMRHHVHMAYQRVPPSSVTSHPSHHVCKERNRRGLSSGDSGHWAMVGLNTILGSHPLVCIGSCFGTLLVMEMKIHGFSSLLYKNGKYFIELTQNLHILPHTLDLL